MSGETHLRLSAGTRILLHEWVPMGAAWVAFLQRKFECTRARHAHYVTALVDRLRNKATVEVDRNECTKMTVSSYVPDEILRLIADVTFTSTAASHQSEQIGIDIDHSGIVRYGVKLCDRAHVAAGYGVGEMAAVIADLNDDTSHVMDGLLNGYQRWLLDVIYQNERRHREKFVALLTPGVLDERGQQIDLSTSWQTVCTALERLIGPLVDSSADTAQKEVWLLGEYGICVIGTGGAVWELAQSLAGIESLRTLRDHLVERIAWSWENLCEQRGRTTGAVEQDVSEIQTDLSRLSSDHTLMASVPARMRETLADWQSKAGDAPACDAAGEPLRAIRLRKTRFLTTTIAQDAWSLETLGGEIANVRALARSLADQKTFRISRATSAMALLSAIFLPLTLITGIYGMNFQRAWPAGSTPAAPANMPELYWKYGYPATLLGMATLATLIFLFLTKRGLIVPFWKTRGPHGEDGGRQRAGRPVARANGYSRGRGAHTT